MVHASMWTLVNAIRQGNCDVVDSILKTVSEVPPNLIADACSVGNVDMVTRLLQYPMNVNYGMNMAVRSGNVHLLDHLFLAGANVNHVDKYGHTLLHHARDAKTCKWLIDMGILPSPPVNCRSVLHRAVCLQDEAMVEMLLKHGEPQVTNNSGETPLHIACRKENVRIVELLLLYGSKQIPNNKGVSPIHLAHKRGKDEIVNLLLNSHDTTEY